jgi:dephospho-CoA kinase
LIVCVTGNIAAGKNTVSLLLEKQGWTAIDADALVHEVAARLTPVILSTFKKEAQKTGITLQKADGTLDRRALGALVFPRPDLLKKQESLVYPEVEKLMDNFFAACPEKNIVINATVLYKIPALMNQCRAILFITAPVLLRFFRIRKRDHMKCIQILARFKSQRKLKSYYEETGIPVIVVHNSGNINRLSHSVSRAVAAVRGTIKTD